MNFTDEAVQIGLLALPGLIAVFIIEQFIFPEKERTSRFWTLVFVNCIVAYLSVWLFYTLMDMEFDVFKFGDQRIKITDKFDEIAVAIPISFGVGFIQGYFSLALRERVKVARPVNRGSSQSPVKHRRSRSVIMDGGISFLAQNDSIAIWDKAKGIKVTGSVVSRSGDLIVLSDYSIIKLSDDSVMSRGARILMTVDPKDSLIESF